LKPTAQRSEGRSSKRGFTLLELMIVVAIIAIIAAIAIPNLLSARINSNESAAVACLRSITTAQMQFWRSQFADQDQDGQGEYGVFGELGGSVGVRGGTSKTPTDLTASMAQVTSTGEVKRSGYVFRMFLPGPGGVGVRELADGGVNPLAISPDLSEVYWCCYAWPENYAQSGHHTFVVNQRCEILKAEDSLYTAVNSTAIHCGAAYSTGNIDAMTSQIASGTVGADGNLWKPIQ
jgi:prepilin-type N-terminal cleavage/methylation domain-containing protein